MLPTASTTEMPTPSHSPPLVSEQPATRAARSATHRGIPRHSSASGGTRLVFEPSNTRGRRAHHRRRRRRLGSAGGRRRSVSRARLPGGAGGVGAASARAPAACRAWCSRATGGRAGGRGPALPQDQQLRRVHLRLGLGERRAPRGRPLLPEAGRGDPVHAGDRPAPARAIRACPTPTPAAVTAALLRGVRRGRRRRARLVDPLPVLHRGREGRARRRTSTCRACRCSFTGTTAPSARSRASTTSWRRSGRATASRCARSGRPRRRTGSPSAPRRAPSWRRATGAALHAFYLANIARHGGIAYLNERFFEVARATLAHRLVATLAYRGAEPVAGTINFEKGAHLYGRYWGCLDDFQMLHFELCYYRLIERAIERRYTLFEAGRAGRAQAEARPRAGVHAQRALDPRPRARRDAHRRVRRARGRRPSPRQVRGLRAPPSDRPRRRRRASEPLRRGHDRLPVAG